MEQFYSYGKLLLTGEYVVLDGALALAFPTKAGQWLMCRQTSEGGIRWKSYDHTGGIWFDFHLFSDEASSAEQQFLEKLLLNAKKLNKDFSIPENIQIETRLTFPQKWGWGSSSTLINNIAQWAKVDAFSLLWMSVSASGYDIACAQNQSPILYRVQDRCPKVYPVNFSPSFKDCLFFVYLERKQNSAEAIKLYKSLKNRGKVVEQITAITENVLRAETLSEFSELLNKHESLISDVLSVPTVKSKHFPDYNGVVKSLGAWGGDFVLVTGEKNEVESYFNDKGFSTVLSFSQVVL